MSDAIGPVAFREGEEHPFLGKEIHEQREFSEETATLIDEEDPAVPQRGGRPRVDNCSIDHRDKLDKLAQGLMEEEILDREQMTAHRPAGGATVQADPAGVAILPVAGTRRSLWG